MSREFHIGQTVIPYEIDWSESRETVGLSLDESMELTVRAPMSATVADVEGVLQSRREWLLEKLYGLTEQADTPREKEFLSGEKLAYRGRDYRLNVVEADVSEPEVSFDGNEFTLAVHRFDAPGDEASVRRKRQAIVDWYVHRAADEFPERVERFAPRLGLDGIATEVASLEGRWGEHEKETIRLNWRLLLAPVRIQDYVIAHELAHTVHEEHDTAFWNTVGTLVPDYESRREWLRLHGNALVV
jgi:hypothetical protein